MSKSNTEKNNALKDLRTESKLTQAQMAKKINISRSLWSALENRQRPLTVALLNRIAAVLELSDDKVTAIRLWWGESHSQSTVVA